MIHPILVITLLSSALISKTSNQNASAIQQHFVSVFVAFQTQNEKYSNICTKNFPSLPATQPVAKKKTII